MTTFDADPSTPHARIPSEGDLRGIFQTVISAWSRLNAEDTSLVSQLPSDSTLERKIILDGIPRLHLVLRVPRAFASALGPLILGCEAPPCDPDDTASELANIYAGHLKDLVWGADSPAGIFLPEKSAIRDWPRGRAQVTCSLKVGEYPVEILLWATSTRDPRR